MFGDQVITLLIQTDEFGGVCACIVQHHEFLDGLGENGIADAHRESSARGITFNLEGLSQATVAVKGKQFVNDAPLQIGEGRCLGSGFERNKES